MYNDFVKPLVEAKEKIDALEKENSLLMDANQKLRCQLAEEQQVAAQQMAASSAGLINTEALCALANGLLVQQPICVSICIGEQSEVYLDGDD